MAGHRMFPLGLECAHCERWHGLRDAIAHAEEFHNECGSCKIEMMLSQALLDEALTAQVTVMQTHRRRMA